MNNDSTAPEMYLLQLMNFVSDSPPPPGSNFMITENGNRMETELNNYMITE